MTETALKQRLRRLTMGVVIVILLLCLTAGSALQYLYQSMQETTQIQLQAETQEYKKRILKQIDYNFQCLRTVAAVLRYEDVTQRERMAAILHDANDSNTFINMVFFLPDKTGVVARWDDSTELSLPLEECHPDVIDAVERALEGEEVLSRLFTSDLFQREEETQLCVYSVPVYLDGEIVGALAASDKIDIFEDILSGDTVLGGQGYIHLLNEEGEFLIRSPYSVIKEKPENFFDDRFMSEEAQNAARQAFATGESTFSSFVYDGHRYQFYIEPVGINDWYLYCADSDMNTMRYLGNILTVMAVALTVVVLVAVTVLYVSYRSFRKNSEALMKLAYYDSVTGAENAARFAQRMQECMNRQQPYSIAAVNIHRFKFINELYGSSAGDRILCDLKAAIQAQLRGNEFFCRDSADLFYILLEDTEESVLRSRLEALISAAQATWQPRFGNGVSLYCGISVGGETMQALMAMQSIQNDMQTDITFYDAQVHDEERRKTQIQNHMQQALEDEEYQLFLQPKICLATGTLIGAEALVRWRKPDGSYRFPNEFIPLFEANGFCTKLDLYMVEQVCRQLRKWMDEGRQPVEISVNQTRLLFFSAGYVDKLYSIVRKYDIPPRLVTLEILEGVAVGNVEAFNTVIDRLHEKGFRVSMDDFGSGYSSLNALYQLKIDELKLDRGFLAMTAGGEDAARQRAILDQIIQFARTMGLSTVAEGIETEEDAALMRELHCDMGQGYFYSKPIDVETFNEKFMP